MTTADESLESQIIVIQTPDGEVLHESAAFIIKAVRCHAELLAALQRTRQIALEPRNRCPCKGCGDLVAIAECATITLSKAEAE